MMPKFVTMPIESKSWEVEKFNKEIIRRVNLVKSNFVVVSYKGKNSGILAFKKGLKRKEFGDKIVMSHLAYIDWQERNPND
jgi:hypothetical protein